MQKIITTLLISSLFIIFNFSVESNCAKILQITQKNLPNVLKFQPDILVLYHHPDCQYSTSYKIKFTNFFQNNEVDDNTNVGVVDCSQESDFCVLHNVTQYPCLRRIFSNLSTHNLQPNSYLGTFMGEHKQTDQFLSSQISQKLRQDPNFIVALFEQQGLPVSQQGKLKDFKYSNRIFYLSQQGRVAQTLLGFVKNKIGCWIFQLKSQQSGQLFRYSCGDSYQSLSQLRQILLKYLNETSIKKPHRASQTWLLDNSVHENELILGYKQLTYGLKHYDLPLELSTHERISICSYIYLWSQTCQHCNYDSDVKTINKTVEKAYENQRHKLSTNQVLKSKIHSYDVQSNKIVSRTQDIAKLTGLSANQVNGVEQAKLLLVPNLLSICIATYNNRKLPETVFLDIKRMDRIICSENINQFINPILESQHRHISGESLTKQQQAKQTQL